MKIRIVFAEPGEPPRGVLVEDYEGLRDLMYGAHEENPGATCRIGCGRLSGDLYVALKTSRYDGDGPSLEYRVGDSTFMSNHNGPAAFVQSRSGLYGDLESMGDDCLEELSRRIDLRASETSERTPMFW